MHVNIKELHVVSISNSLINFYAFIALDFSHLEVFVLVQQVSHGAIQFTAYEELRKGIIDFKSKDRKKDSESDDKLLVSHYNQRSLEFGSA